MILPEKMNEKMEKDNKEKKKKKIVLMYDNFVEKNSLTEFFLIVVENKVIRNKYNRKGKGFKK